MSLKTTTTLATQTHQARDFSFTPPPLRSNHDPIKERIIDTDKGFVIERSQRADATIQAVKEAGNHMGRKTAGDGSRYLGSVPLIVCEIWAKECGSSVGTREFLEYANKKLHSGEFAKLKVDLK